MAAVFDQDAGALPRITGQPDRRDNLPSSLANGTMAEALDAVLELRGYVEELQAVALPKGFGRD